jgi:hypothetical protein
MDFHLATPQGDLYLFSAEAGRVFDAPAPVAAPPSATPSEIKQPRAPVAAP